MPNACARASAIRRPAFGFAIVDNYLPVLDRCGQRLDELVDLVTTSTNVVVMKVLTIIATIFIPLGFIAGIYAMNFDPEASSFNMPELGWFFGYPFALAMMLSVAIGMLFYFRWKGWLAPIAHRQVGRQQANPDTAGTSVAKTGGVARTVCSGREIGFALFRQARDLVTGLPVRKAG